MRLSVNEDDATVFLNNVAISLKPQRGQLLLYLLPKQYAIRLEKNGFIADSSKTYLVGEAPPAAKRLVRVAQEAMWKGIGQVRPGAHIGDIGFAIERHAKKHG